jgi:hypothetical protein
MLLPTSKIDVIACDIFSEIKIMSKYSTENKVM